MGAPKVPYPFRYPQPLGALRLQLSPASAEAPEHGVWWPYGRALAREGAHLVDDFPRERGRVDRLVYSPRDWDMAADQMFTSHGRIKVGYLPPAHGGGVVLLRLLGAGIIPIHVVWVAPRVFTR